MDTTKIADSDTLLHSVVRIKAGDANDPKFVHSGTGFFYVFECNEGHIPAIISNRHVLCDKSWLQFHVAEKDNNHNRILGAPIRVTGRSDQFAIIGHPDPDVDLAAASFSGFPEALEQNGKSIHATFLSKKLFPPENMIRELRTGINVSMIGFPVGLMDEVNNLPVARRGALATPYFANYMGRSDFVADIAAFPGSSGSPVFATFDNIRPDGRGGVAFGPGRISYFIGILHSGPVMAADGEIIQAPVPTNYAISRTSIMIHLGYCVKSHRIDEFLPEILKRLDAERPSGV